MNKFKPIKSFKGNDNEGNQIVVKLFVPDKKNKGGI